MTTNGILGVLLIEEDADLVATIRNLLVGSSGAGFRLDIAARLSDGIQYLNQTVTDVILLDLSLPDSQGLDTFIQIGGLFPKIPVVILANQADEPIATQSVGAGAQDYLLKDQVEKSNLEHILRNAVERHRLWTSIRSTSFVDELTGFFNRQGFLTVAEQHLKLAYRNQRKFTLVAFELGGIDKINQEFGFPCGDQILKSMAGILQKTFRSSDILARSDGARFLAIAMDTEQDEFTSIVSRLRTHLEELESQSPSPSLTTLFLGYAEFDFQKIVTIENLILEAESKLEPIDQNE